MKDLITKSQKEIKQENIDLLRAAAVNVFLAAIGLISTRAVIFSSLMPFGISFAAGCSAVFLPSVTVGAFLGYFFVSFGTGGFRYIAALLAVLAIRLMLSSYKKISQNPIFLSSIAALAAAVTGGVTYSGVPVDALKLVAETLIIFGSSFIINRTFYAVEKNKYGLLGEELTFLLITVSIVLTGLSGIILYNISLGHIAAVFLLLAAAKYAGTQAAAVSGIAFSFSCALTGSFQSGAIYAFAGLAAGMFSNLGKYAQSISVIATGIIGLSFIDFENGSAVFITEIIIGSLFFLFLPRSLGINISKIFYCYPKLRQPASFTSGLTMRLDLASSALMDVSETVSQVSKELSKINSPDFKTVLSYIEQDACAGCKLRLHCWETKRDSTLDAVMQMISSAKEKGSACEESAPEEFRGRCLRLRKISSSVNERYANYASALAAENRIEEVRSVVSDQFEGVSNMLLELAADFSDDEKFDDRAAENAASALKNIGIRAEECTARVDKYGRMSIEIRVKSDEDTVFNRLQIMKLLSISCERDFDIPNINRIGDSVLITVGEHAVYKIDIGAHQESSNSGSICGDAYKYFNDGKGHFIMVLSDGMGTGGRAAVDGAMASGLMARLLKAGFGFDCSLKILNSSMLFKSTDESLATVDIASIDLFTGNTELYKAGAAPTLVRRNGRTGKAESTSLPIGILRDVSFDRAGIRLRSGDILLLISDGACADGTEWIRAELESWRDGGAEDLAEHICECARRRQGGSRIDDITVMAAIVEKAV